MIRPALGNISAERRVLWELFTMIPAQTFIPVLLLPLSVLMLTSGLRAPGLGTTLVHAKRPALPPSIYHSGFSVSLVLFFFEPVFA
jgi:hypothetical protein